MRRASAAGVGGCAVVVDRVDRVARAGGVDARSDIVKVAAMTQCWIDLVAKRRGYL